MKVELGPEWVPTTRGTYRHATLDVRLHINPTQAPPIDANIERTTQSVTGWPVDWLEDRVSLATGGIEHQLLARYHIFDSVEIVMVAGPADQIAAHRSELETVILSGRHDWSGQVACLSQLLADVDPE